MTETSNSHLSEAQLNEYLDDALRPSARSAMEAHLAACGSCSERLRDLSVVFDELEDLPPAPLARDLRPAVMAAVRAKHSAAPIAVPRRPALQFLFAAEALLAVGLLAFAWPFLAGLGDLFGPAASAVRAWLDLNSLLPALQTWLARAALPPALPLVTLLQPVVAGLVLLVAGGLWLLGNAYLLRPTPRLRRHS